MTQSKRQQSLFETVEPKPAPSTAASPTPTVVRPTGPESHDDLTGKSVYIVDAHALIYQVFYTMQDMSSPKGEAIGAVHGFTRDMVDLLDKKQPDYLFCAFDAPGDTFRHELYSDYKADREAMPDDMRPQIPKIHEMLKALGIPILTLPSYEADDILATLARVADERHAECYIVTMDKDCRQLITDKVVMYNIRKDEIFDTKSLREKWGVRPDQVVDFQALVGDKIDNVPGVPLIGPKMAKDLLEKYDTLENALDHAHEISGKKRKENLLNGRDQAMLSRDLVRLDVNVPVEIDWAEGRVGGVNQERVQQLCADFGFRRLGDRMSSLAVANAPAEWLCDYRLVSNNDELDELVAQLRQQDRISIDTETTNALPRFAELVGYSVSWEEGVAYYIPVRAPEGEPCLDAEHVRELLKPILEDPSIKKIGQNIKYDMLILRSIDIDLQGVYLDTMVADYLLAPGERNHSIDDLAKRYLNHDNVSIKELIGTGKKQISMAEVPVAEVTQYAAEDADVPFRLAPILEARLNRQELEELYFDLEVPLLDVLAEMEWNGIEVNQQRLEELSVDFGSHLDVLENEIYEIAGAPFNIDSRQQLGKILFEQLELPVIKKTKSGPSTDVDVLTELAKKHPLPAKIIEYRQFAKLKSTYVDALQGLIHPGTKRVHTSFKQDVAATGRLSSKDPNLQNIPVRTETGRAIRSAFQPGPEGWKLLTADYSQIELRVLAHFSQDETLRRAFEENKDVHRLVASEVYGVPLDDVTSDMRRAAKAINFGIIYGQTPFGLAKALDISKDEAAEFIDAYIAQYPGVEEFMEEVLDQCNTDNFVSTILGRKRDVAGVKNAMRRGTFRTMPERIAINTVIQGSAADLIKIAMLRLYKRLKDEDFQANMLLQIHDELIFEVPEDQVDALAEIVVEEMSGVYELNVPLKVDVSVGDNWAACEKWGATTNS